MGYIRDNKNLPSNIWNKEGFDMCSLGEKSKSPGKKLVAEKILMKQNMIKHRMNFMKNMAFLDINYRQKMS